MKNNWKEATLDNIAEIIGGGTPKTSVVEYWDGDIPWISVVDFNNDNRWIEKTDKEITKEGLENSSTRLLEKGDLIISARGTVGEIAQLKKPMAFNQSCYGLRAKGENNQNFLYYLVKYNISKIKKNVHGAVFDTITRNTFSEIDVLLPSPGEQKEIAAVLSCLDDKIELLRKENETLEKIAQGIFKEWFVEFNFPNDDRKPYKESGGKMIDSELGEIPEGWRVGNLGDTLSLEYGKALKAGNRTDKGFPVFGSNGIVGYHDNFLVKGDGIVVGRKGTMGSVIWVENNFYPIDTAFYVKDKLGVDKLFFHYLLLLKQDFGKVSSDSAVPGLNRNSACAINAIIPEIQTINYFHELIEPTFSKIKLNNSQIRTLSCLRDTLLPKLMSGEIRILS